MGPSNRARVVGLSLAVWALQACDDGGGEPAPTGCPEQFAACDITQDDCQGTIFRATACARHQQDASMPPVRVITLDQYANEVRDQARDATDEPEWSGAYRLLGLLPPTTTPAEAAGDTAVDNVAAYYDTDTKRVTVIARGGDHDPVEDVLELSHEFVHALQDQAVDLAAFEEKWADSTDAHVAIRALAEGEATVVSTAVTLRSAQRSLLTFPWDRYADDLQTSILDTIGSSEVPFFAAVQTLPYPIGTRYLSSRWLAGGQEALDALYEAPLRAVLDWVADVDDPTDSLAEALACQPATPPAGFTAYDHDTLGTPGVLAVRVAGHEPVTQAWERAAAWRGDSAVVFSAGEKVAVAWRVRWATASDATAFASLLSRTFGTEAKVKTTGREVQLLVASDPSLVERWSQDMACGSADDLPSHPALKAARRVRIP